MRRHGTLTKWNDDRGFGFIAPAEAEKEIFVHISAFPRDGQRPQIGELISFESETGPEGKLRAVRVMRPRSRARSRRAVHDARPARSSRSWVSSLMRIAAISALGAYGYSEIGHSPAPHPITQAAPAAVARPRASVQFQCDGRTMCSQMTSCDEAIYFLRNCPGTTMDGDGDGKPCEQQWCN